MNFWAEVYRKWRPMESNTSIRTILKRIDEIGKECPEPAVPLFRQLRSSLLEFSSYLPDDKKRAFLENAVKIFSTFVKHQQNLMQATPYRSCYRSWTDYLRFAPPSLYRDGRLLVVLTFYRKLGDYYIPFLYPIHFLGLGVDEAISLVTLYLSLGVKDEAPYPLREWVEMKPHMNLLWVVDWLPGITLYLQPELLQLILACPVSLRARGEIFHFKFPFRENLFNREAKKWDLGKAIEVLADEIGLDREVVEAKKIYKKVGLPCREGRLLLTLMPQPQHYPLQATPKGLLRRGIIRV